MKLVLIAYEHEYDHDLEKNILPPTVGRKN